MKPIKYILFVICFLASNLAYSQAENSLLQDVALPAPNAGALGKYADIPVGHYTGAPSISVPLYTLQEGPLSLPISLNYHASGIRVAELASWVGLGWSLDAGGIISRTTRGLPDDASAGYLNKGKDLKDPELFNQYIAPGSPLIPSDPSEEFMEAAEQRRQVVKGQLDAEPDVFSFNVAGYSGKFVFDKNGDIHFMPESDVKIEYVRRTGNNSSGQIFRFILTAPDGTRYVFGTLESESNSSNSGIEFTNFSTTPSNAIAPSSWYLRKIESPDRRHSITLQYTAERYQYVSPGTCSFSTGTSKSNCGPVGYGTQNTSVVVQQMDGKRLEKITCSSGIYTVNFRANNNRDDIGSYLSPKAKRLDKIDITTGGLNCTRTFEFKYSYMNSSGSGKPEFKRLMLNSVQEKSCDGDIPPYAFTYYGGTLPSRVSKAVDHWGYYNGASSNEGTLNIPPQSVLNEAGELYTPNFTTANRESSESHMKYGVLKRITYPLGGYSEFTYEANKIDEIQQQTSFTPIFNLSNCNQPGQACCENSASEIRKTKTFTSEELNGAGYSLSLINLTSHPANSPYPACNNSSNAVEVNVSLFINNDKGEGIGSTSFNLPIHTPYGILPDIGEEYIPLSSIANLQAGKEYEFILYVSWAKAELNIFSPISNTFEETRDVGGLRVKKIVRHDDENSSNNIVREFFYTQSGTSGKSSGNLYFEPAYYGYDTDVWGFKRAITFRSSPVSPMGNFQGNHIGYSRVVERINGNGSTVHTFTIEYALSTYLDQYPYAPHEFTSADGKPIKQTVYKQGSSTPLQETTYERHGDGYEYIPGHMYMASSFYVNGGSSSGSGPNNLEYYSFKAYNIRTAPYRIKKQTLKLDGVSATTEYSYDEKKRHLFPTKTRVTNSSGRISEQRFKYPLDYVHSLKFDNGSDITIKALTDQHMISVPIETQTWEGSSASNLKMTGGQIQIYKDFSSSGTPILKPSKIFLFETTDPKSSVNDGFNNNIKQYAKLKPQDVSSNYKERAYFIYESSYGSLVEQSLKDGTPVSFKWDFDGNRPLAQVVGKTWSQIKNTSVSSLRGNFKDALVTTYTYDGRLRVTSITGPDGIKTSYNYDGLDRLVQTKDDDGKLLQTVKYNLPD